MTEVVVYPNNSVCVDGAMRSSIDLQTLNVPLVRSGHNMPPDGAHHYQRGRTRIVAFPTDDGWTRARITASTGTRRLNYDKVKADYLARRERGINTTLAEVLVAEKHNCSRASVRKIVLTGVNR